MLYLSSLRLSKVGTCKRSYPLDCCSPPSPPTLPDNTDNRVVRSLLEGGMVLKGMMHRHVMQLLGAHASDTEKPMLLFPKTMHGSLKDLLVNTREQKRGAMVGGTFGHGMMGGTNYQYVGIELPFFAKDFISLVLLF